MRNPGHFEAFLAYFWPNGGLFGGFWAYSGLSGVLGLDLGLFVHILSLIRPILGIWDWIWAILMGPGPGFGPLWAYFQPKSAHLWDLGLDLGDFGRSGAW